MFKAALAQGLYDALVQHRDHPQTPNINRIAKTPGLRYWRWTPNSPFLNGCRGYIDTYPVTSRKELK